jgi:hypothetical protein
LEGAFCEDEAQRIGPRIVTEYRRTPSTPEVAADILLGRDKTKAVGKISSP